MSKVVSVPIRGLFNLTFFISIFHCILLSYMVSVPIRGLFNLTARHDVQMNMFNSYVMFPSPLGDYLI